MARYFIRLSYDGTNYHGWQVQDNAKTVQGEINKALTTIIGGGTGWILKHLPADCEKVVFVEPSREMIVRAARESVRFPLYLLKDYYENITIQKKVYMMISILRCQNPTIFVKSVANKRPDSERLRFILSAI